MSASTAILFAIFAPLVAIPGIALCNTRPNLREAIILLTASLVFISVSSLFVDVANGGRPSLQLGEILPGLSLMLALEPLGMLFAGIASFLWIVTTIYSIGYMRGHQERNQTRFYIYFAIAISSALGIAFAGNMFTLFIFYEVLTISTFPLVTHSGSDEAKRAGRIYLGILIGTSIFLQLTAIIWTWNIAGTLDFTVGGILNDRASAGLTGLLIAMYVFGIGKAAVMPFHHWLPAAMVAPTPVSALLHAVAVVKAGVFTVLKVTIYIFGIDNLASLGSSNWLQYIAAATILIASLIAMSKDNLKARLAYSTVSQLSYIVLGAMMASAAGVLGGAMHIATHAFGKITLFFCAGAIMVASHKSEISQMRGLGHKMPITFICFLIASLSIIGLPPFGGMWSKWYLALGAAKTDQQVFIAVLMISSLLNVAYLLPIVARGFFSKSKGTKHDDVCNEIHGIEPQANNPNDDAVSSNQWKFGGMEEAPVSSVIAIILTTVGCGMLFFYADAIYHFLLPLIHGEV